MDNFLVNKLRGVVPLTGYSSSRDGGSLSFPQKSKESAVGHCCLNPLEECHRCLPAIHEIRKIYIYIISFTYKQTTTRDIFM